jgi:hypothetical protein
MCACVVHSALDVTASRVESEIKARKAALIEAVRARTAELIGENKAWHQVRGRSPKDAHLAVGVDRFRCVCASMQARSKELHASLTESALVLSGAAVLQAEACDALSALELGLLKAKRSLELLCTRVRENLQSAAAASGAAVEVVVTAELECKALAATIRTSGALRVCTAPRCLVLLLFGSAVFCHRLMLSHVCHAFSHSPQ